MAVSEGQSSLLSWKKSFVTAIRQNENACQDIFQNSEKLLASAVSICRLKGSVECQTGGLITVCEELQSLVRLAFSEVKRVEKDLRSQNTKLEKEIFNLIEKVKHLEEEKRDSKLLNNEVTHTAEQRTSEPLRNGRNRKSKEAIANKIPCHSSLTHSETSIPDDDSDSYMFNADYAENTVVVSVENAQISKDQTVSICPKESKKWNSRKRLKKLTSESDHEISSPAEVGDSNLEGLPSCTKENEEKQHSQKPTSVGKKSNTVIEEKPPLEEKQKRHPEGNSEVQSERATKGTKCTRRSTLRKKKADCNKQETEEFMGDKKSDAWNSKEKLEQKEVFKEAKKTKTRKTESLQNELLSQDDTNLVEDIPETMKSHERNKSTVDNKESKDFSVKESMDVKMKVVSLEGDSQDHKPEFKARKRLSCNKNSKLSHECIIKINKMSMEEGNEELKIALTQNSQLRGKSVEGEISGISDESAAMDDHDEPLGDMSFLIDVNSKISLFVSDAAQEECELDPMTARERNEVYKVAQIYKLRARIGTKAANNLATVRLSKQADTKMPKPGQVDRLLSELSIAASKEALKDSPKSHIKKRKYGIEVDKNKNGNDSDQSGPPKKKFAKKFRSNKD